MAPSGTSGWEDAALKPGGGRGKAFDLTLSSCSLIFCKDSQSPAVEASQEGSLEMMVAEIRLLRVQRERRVKNGGWVGKGPNKKYPLYPGSSMTQTTSSYWFPDFIKDFNFASYLLIYHI